MPATVTLEENGHLVHIVFEDPITFEEFNSVEDQANIWADTTPHILHTFLDARRLRRLPEGFLKFRNASGLTKMKRGTTVILGASLYVQRIAETIMVLTRNTSTCFFPANEADAAMNYIRQIIVQELTAADSERA